MNDLDLIDRHGPVAADLSDTALEAARARLAATITASTASAPMARRKGRVSLLVAASVAAAAGVGFTVVPALVGSEQAIALVAVNPETFPITATWLPAGLGDPVFSYDLGRAWVQYGTGEDRIGIATEVDPDDEGCRDNDATRLDINGQPGWGFDGCADEPSGPATNPPAYFVEWEQPDGDVLMVGGHGRYADPVVVEHVAESVEDRVQPVDLFLSIAPSGWQLRGYQSDHHVTWSDPDGEQGGDGSDLTVGLVNRVDANLEPYGARDVHEVDVDGRRALIGRQVDEDDNTVLWVLQGTAPDGTAFSLAAPGRFTEDQVLEVASGVRHR